MTASKPSLFTAARSDPVGAGIVVCVSALAALAFVQWAPPVDVELPTWRWPSITMPDIIARPKPVQRPLEKPPEEWRKMAKAADVLTVPGVPVAYWGKPDATYGTRVTAEAQKPVAIVVHFTDDRPATTLIRYQHNGDSDRGGAYGYHVYIDRQGRVYQGAPLSARTNHIKPAGDSHRKGVGSGLDGSNTIGISLVGACQSPALSPITYRCNDETPSAEQIEAGLAVVKALRVRFKIRCQAIYGHGDLQNDRKSFEGLTLSRRVRAECFSTEDKIEIDADAPGAAVELERAYSAGLRDMLFIYDSRPRVIARRGPAKWSPRDPNSTAFTGPSFANGFIAAHPEYSRAQAKADDAPRHAFDTPMALGRKE